MPQPKNLSSSYTAIYDAWNRLVQILDPALSTTIPIATYEYDGLNRRIVTTTNANVDETIDETRHYYFSNRWQVLEERVDTSTDPDRQFVWGARYVDDLVLRDRDTSDPKNGTLDERLYALNDALFNVTALINTSGTVQERFQYNPYGESKVLTPAFADRASSDYNWEYRFTGRRLDPITGLQINRNRYYHNGIGRWVNRDPIGYTDGWNLYGYALCQPITVVDPQGLYSYCGIFDADGSCRTVPRPPSRTSHCSCSCDYYDNTGRPIRAPNGERNPYIIIVPANGRSCAGACAALQMPLAGTRGGSRICEPTDRTPDPVWGGLNPFNIPYMACYEIENRERCETCCATVGALDLSRCAASYAAQMVGCGRIRHPLAMAACMTGVTAWMALCESGAARRIRDCADVCKCK